MIPPVTPKDPDAPHPNIVRQAKEAYNRVREVAAIDQQPLRNATDEPPKRQKKLRWPPHVGQNLDVYA